MPYTVGVSFDKFIENITVPGTHKETADARRDAIVALLKDKFDIVEAFSTGSLVRGTGLRGHADVDVVVALNYGKHIKDKSPTKVLEDVRDHLKEYNTKMAKKNGQAVTLYFKTWPNVDIVPATRVVNGELLVGYEIPDMNRGIWIDTYPQMHDKAMARLSAKDLTRIRMVKAWNMAHSELLTSFHIETIALSVPTMTDTWAWELRNFFDKAVQLIENPLYHPNSTNGQVDSYLSWSGRSTAKERLSRGLTWARDAWYATERKNNDEEAIRIYRTMFGDKFPAYG